MYSPNMVRTRTGGISMGTEAYRQREGGLCLLVVRWATVWLEGVKQLAALRDVASLLSIVTHGDEEWGMITVPQPLFMISHRY